MKIFIHLVIAFFMATPAVAALAPFYQSVKEIKTILETNALEKLNPNAINKIDREVSPDGMVLYSITTASCKMVFQIISPDRLAPEFEEEPKHSSPNPIGSSPNPIGLLGATEFALELKSNSCE
jgi:hypothetical protein